MKEEAALSNACPKLAVKWLNEVLCFVFNSEEGERFMLRKSAFSPCSNPLALMLELRCKSITIVLKRAEKMPTLRKIKTGAIQKQANHSQKQKSHFFTTNQITTKEI
jgi:hypothetical protein